MSWILILKDIATFPSPCQHNMKMGLTMNNLSQQHSHSLNSSNGKLGAADKQCRDFDSITRLLLLDFSKHSSQHSQHSPQFQAL